VGERSEWAGAEAELFLVTMNPRFPSIPPFHNPARARPRPTPPKKTHRQTWGRRTTLSSLNAVLCMLPGMRQSVWQQSVWLVFPQCLLFAPPPAHPLPLFFTGLPLGRSRVVYAPCWRVWRGRAPPRTP